MVIVEFLHQEQNSACGVDFCLFWNCMWPSVSFPFVQQQLVLYWTFVLVLEMVRPILYFDCTLVYRWRYEYITFLIKM